MDELHELFGREFQQHGEFREVFGHEDVRVRGSIDGRGFRLQFGNQHEDGEWTEIDPVVLQRFRAIGCRFTRDQVSAMQQFIRQIHEISTDEVWWCRADGRAYLRPEMALEMVAAVQCLMRLLCMGTASRHPREALQLLRTPPMSPARAGDHDPRMSPEPHPRRGHHHPAIVRERSRSRDSPVSRDSSRDDGPVDRP